MVESIHSSRRNTCLKWCYQAYSHPITYELFTRVLDWELAFLIKRDIELLGHTGSTRAMATELGVTQQSIRNRLKKLEGLGMLISADAGWIGSDDLQDLLERYLNQIAEIGQQTGLWAMTRGHNAIEPAEMLRIILEINQHQTSGKTTLTGTVWIILVELAWAEHLDIPVDATQLGASCRLSPNSITTLLTRLEKRQLIRHKKAPDDARRIYWVIDTNGYEELAHYLDRVLEIMEA